MSFFLFLLFALFLFWIIRPIWKIYRSFNQMRNAFNQSARNNRQYSQNEGQNSHQQTHKGKNEEKIIPHEYGEYVEFTETTSYSEDKTMDNNTKQRKVYREEQISDAEWEDVK